MNQYQYDIFEANDKSWYATRMNLYFIKTSSTNDLSRERNTIFERGEVWRDDYGADYWRGMKGNDQVGWDFMWYRSNDTPNELPRGN